jgi:hypothetical protein
LDVRLDFCGRCRTVGFISSRLAEKQTRSTKPHEASRTGCLDSRYFVRFVDRFAASRRRFETCPYCRCVGSFIMLMMINCHHHHHHHNRHRREAAGSGRRAGRPLCWPPSWLVLLVGNGCRRAIEFRDVDSERLVIGLGPVPQDAKRDLLAQQYRPVSRATEVYASVNPVTKRDVVR